MPHRAFAPSLPLPSGRPAVAVAIIGLFALALSGGSCAQGEGDRCEVDEDCKSGLTCQEIQTVPVRERVCRQPGSGVPNVDAAPGVTLDAQPGPVDVAASDTSVPADVAPDAPASPDLAPDTAPAVDLGADLLLDATPASDGSANGG